MVTSRESAQVRNSWEGRCPSRASRASSSAHQRRGVALERADAARQLMSARLDGTDRPRGPADSARRRRNRSPHRTACPSPRAPGRTPGFALVVAPGRPGPAAAVRSLAGSAIRVPARPATSTVPPCAVCALCQCCSDSYAAWSMNEPSNSTTTSAPSGYEVQGPAEPGHREERQLSAYVYVMDSSSLGS